MNDCMASITGSIVTIGASIVIVGEKPINFDSIQVNPKLFQLNLSRYESIQVDPIRSKLIQFDPS